MSDQNNRAQDKAALEIDILRQEIRIKEKELELKEKALKDLETSKTWKLDPVIVGIVAALIGFLGNVFATYWQGKNSLTLERAKYEVSRSLETDKFRSSLILEAIKTGDTERQLGTLSFFSPQDSLKINLDTLPNFSPREIGCRFCRQHHQG